MTRASRLPLFAALGLATVLLTACGPGGGTPSASPEPSTPEPTAAGPLPCAVGDLGAELRFPDGAAGTLHFQLWIDNLGDAPCTLVGTPGLIVVDASGNQLGAAASRTVDDAAEPVTLEPGNGALTEFQMTNIAGGGGPLGPDCAEVDGAGYRVILPDSDEFVFVSDPGFPACTAGQSWMSIDGPLHAPF
jgi:hypothetical protein